MKFLVKRDFICIESRTGFIKQVIRWFLLHVLSLLLPIAIYYYGFENEFLNVQFQAVGLLLLSQGLMLVFLDRILNVDGRLHDIYPGAPRFCQKHMGAIMLVPVLSILFVGFLCLKGRSEKRVPFLISHPGLFAEGALLIFLFTVASPIASLLDPKVKLYGLNYWLATPGAYTVTQTVEKVRYIGLRAQDPELLQVSDLAHPPGENVYVSALTFELVKKKLMNDLTKTKTRAIASDDFERELGYVGNLCELMKWADNSETMFTYFHPGYVVPMSGWDTSLAFMAEQYFLHSFKREVHREINFFFAELEVGLKAGPQKERLKGLRDEYASLKSTRSLNQIDESWLSVLF